MAHYAFLDENNIVTEVIVGIDETELIEGLDTEIWYGNFRNQTCKRTSYNNKIRKQFAGVGFRYDADKDIFIAPQTYPSWTLDDEGNWVAPVPMPESGDYYWDEEQLTWLESEPSIYIEKESNA